ncbi:MAG: AmmeMemoRadiSam system protein B [Candidatus Heimdallarchaeota archaeon]
MTIRLPVVAGQFYEGDEEHLKREIEHSFLHKLGPGKLPDQKGTKRLLKAVVSPHAGYIYSGPVAAFTFSEIFKDGEPEVFVVLGPNHHLTGETIAVWSRGSWKTPLGEVMIDERVADAIINQSRYAEADEHAHQHEHSIEVQLPFLQFLFPHAKIVPISMKAGSLTKHQVEETWKRSTEVGRAVAGALDKIGIDGMVIASSDFTHFESARSAQSKDHEAIEKILALDDEGFVQTVYNRNASICGYAPIVASIVFAKEKGAKSGKLLKYATSGDVTGDFGHVVAYSSIIFQ